jgi:hypothetical protein
MNDTTFSQTNLAGQSVWVGFDAFLQLTQVYIFYFFQSGEIQDFFVVHIDLL